MNNITYFAKTNFRNQEKTFGIKPDDRRRHVYLIGKTGMGKTECMKNMVIQDIQNGHGVAILDPHGDAAEDLLNFVPPSRINDVVYFNPADEENPIAFNILESVDGRDKKYLIASGLMGVFKKLWPDVWSARMEYLLNNTILALLEYPSSTMLGINRMFSDKEFRKKVVDRVTDPLVKSFWVNEFAKYTDRLATEATSAVQNKVGQFLSSAIIRNIIGQPKSTISMRDIMNNQKILIVNLSKGKIGEDNMKLLGGMIVTKLQLAAMERVNIPEEDRKDFYLYVDELQNFVNESFAGILSEARKYRLSLTLAHQYIKQLPEVIRDAIFGNAGTLITFRIGAEDAEFLEKEFEPAVMMNDIINLPKYNIYLKLMIDGITSNAFSAVSLPPMKPAEASSVDKVVKVSRERYSKKKMEVEEKIIRWIGVDIGDNSKGNLAGKENGGYSGSGGGENPPEMFKAECAQCGKPTFVPFKPDERRPVFCEKCLKNLRSSGATFSYKKAGNGQEQNGAVQNKENRVSEAPNLPKKENYSQNNNNQENNNYRKPGLNQYNNDLLSEAPKKEVSIKDALQKALAGETSKQVVTKSRQKEVDVAGIRDLVSNVLNKRMGSGDGGENKSDENGKGIADAGVNNLSGQNLEKPSSAQAGNELKQGEEVRFS
ncbi:MAG: type IV secretion system DNA-binding domain-containing protein [bacterium]